MGFAPVIAGIVVFADNRQDRGLSLICRATPVIRHELVDTACHVLFMEVSACI